jgi:hypothetical protein
LHVGKTERRRGFGHDRSHRSAGIGNACAIAGDDPPPYRLWGEKPPSRIIDFDALSDLEESLLLIDATTAPYVHKYQSVKKFLESPYQETRDVDIAPITGVGSSALGSAALAWDISVALERARCARPAQCLGSLAQILAADLREMGVSCAGHRAGAVQCLVKRRTPILTNAHLSPRRHRLGIFPRNC